VRVTSGLIGLSSLIALLAMVAAVAGLFTGEGGESFLFSTLRGGTARIFGRGLYRYDTVFFGAGFRGQDVVALFFGVPLLITSIILYQRGGLPGQFLLVGVLGYFLYLYASMALGAAYNRLFLLYVALVSASLFAFLQVLPSAASGLAAAGTFDALPRRGLAAFLFASGAVTLMVWLVPLLEALARGGPPQRMDSYTTMVTYALDLAVITPATFVSAVLVLQGSALGYAVASTLLTLLALLAPQIILSTLFQRAAGVPFSAPEWLGPVIGFVILGASATWLLITLQRGLAALSVPGG